MIVLLSFQEDKLLHLSLTEIFQTDEADGSVPAFTLAEAVFTKQIPQHKDIIKMTLSNFEKHRCLKMSECNLQYLAPRQLSLLMCTDVKKLTSLSRCCVSSSVQHAAQQHKPQHV